MIVSAARLGTPASQSRIGGTIRPSSKTLVASEGIEPGTAPPMSSWWPKAWTNATTLAAAEDRDGDAQVGQVPDAALGAVDVVVEEHVALAHLLDREVAGDRVHERGVGAAGQLAQQPVVDAGPEVVGVADHRAAAGARDRGLDLHLDAGQRALHDLDQHRVGARARVRGQAAERELGRGPPAAHCSALRVTMMLQVVVDPGGEARVQRHRRAELLDDRRARHHRADGQVGAPQHRGVDVPLRRVEADRPRRRWFEVRAERASKPSSTGCFLISGRWIGPMPDTRRLTHSTCWLASSAKS